MMYIDYSSLVKTPDDGGERNEDLRREKGIVTRSCKAIINFAFTELGLNRIEIKCAVSNDKSKGVAEKLQFKYEGILRQAELLHGKFIDLHLFGMVKEEWGGKN